MKTKSFLVGFFFISVITLLMISICGAGIYLYLSHRNSSVPAGEGQDLDAEKSSEKTYSPAGVKALIEKELGLKLETDQGDVAGVQSEVYEDSLFKTATDAFKNGGAYSYRSDAKISLALSIPGVNDVAMDMDMVAEGSENLQTGDEYSKATYTVEGVTQTSEVYFIGDDVYIKTAKEWEKFSRSEAHAQGVMSDDEITTVMKGLSTQEQYTFEDGGVLNSEWTVVYTVPLEGELLDQFTSTFLEAFKQSSGGMIPGELSATGGELRFWVGKTSERVIAAEVIIPTLTFSVTYEGVTMNISLKDLTIQTQYFDWGKPVTYQAPV